ncbi:MAG: serpin family protein [Lachnospiraceae bacterium]|nr:serpin family protein [Lachnospiraceae bacterium]
MRPEDIYKAIGETDDELLLEAEKLSPEAEAEETKNTKEPVDITEKRKGRGWIARITAIAACAALFIGGMFAYTFNKGNTPGGNGETAQILVEAKVPAGDYTSDGAVPQLPDVHEGEDPDVTADPSKLTKKLSGKEGALLIMPDDGENHAYSPVNISLALAMLSETTDDETRQQIYGLLGVSSEEELRAYIAELFAQAYYDGENGKSLLANSIWLRNDGTQYNEDVLRVLAEYYCTSSFSGEMGSKEYDEMLRKWINEHTENLLEQEAGELGFDRSTIIALASTIYYHADWMEPFFEEATKQQVFHAPDGDRSVQMMYTGKTDYYYRGEHFGAVSLRLADGNNYWIFLPDEGYTVEDVLSDDAMMEIIRQEAEGEYADVTIGLPRYDISASLDLKDVLKEMGVTDVFDGSKADFTPLLGEEGSASVSHVQHAARVSVDEYGLTAAAFTVITADGAMMPPDKHVDLICDRPFVFAVANDSGLVFFEGVVNRP